MYTRKADKRLYIVRRKLHPLTQLAMQTGRTPYNYHQRMAYSLRTCEKFPIGMYRIAVFKIRPEPDTDHLSL